jgi:thiamine-monophosphate kinase
MTTESAFIDRLRALASDPAARGLLDDAAVLPAPLGRDLVLTHDVLVEGVHFLATDPPGDVAWKLVAVNLSDLAAKGAAPIGVLAGYTLGGDPDWDEGFLAGFARVLGHFDLPLLGGDTVALPPGTARVLGLTAIGQTLPGAAPARSGAKPGDRLWVTGPVGDAGLGLRIAKGELDGPRRLLKAYRLPMPRLAAGRALAPHVHAMADISDGLLIDADRMAAASGLAVSVDLDAVPLSEEALALVGGEREARLAAATAGDDYELLFAAPDDVTERLMALPQLNLTAVGRFGEGSGITIRDAAGPVPLPARLGFEHRSGSTA